MQSQVHTQSLNKLTNRSIKFKTSHTKKILIPQRKRINIYIHRYEEQKISFTMSERSISAINGISSTLQKHLTASVDDAYSSWTVCPTDEVVTSNCSNQLPCVYIRHKVTN